MPARSGSGTLFEKLGSPASAAFGPTSPAVAAVAMAAAEVTKSLRGISDMDGALTMCRQPSPACSSEHWRVERSSTRRLAMSCHLGTPRNVGTWLVLDTWEVDTYPDSPSRRHSMRRVISLRRERARCPCHREPLSQHLTRHRIRISLEKNPRISRIRNTYDMHTGTGLVYNPHGNTPSTLMVCHTDPK